MGGKCTHKRKEKAAGKPCPPFSGGGEKGGRDCKAARAGSSNLAWHSLSCGELLPPGGGQTSLLFLPTTHTTYTCTFSTPAALSRQAARWHGRVFIWVGGRRGRRGRKKTFSIFCWRDSLLVAMCVVERAFFFCFLLSSGGDACFLQPFLSIPPKHCGRSLSKHAFLF